MICNACKTQDHTHCLDHDESGQPKPGMLYASCNCRHVVAAEAEPATGPAGE